MILYTLLFKIVLCQDLIIWLRVTSISSSHIKEDLYQEFCYLDNYIISVEYQNNLNIIVFQDYTNINQLQIHDNLGQWIKLDIFKLGNIVIDEKKLSINKTIDQIKFTQIKKNYNDFYLEISEANKQNNLILQNWKQPYFYDLTFNAFISDSDAMITLWYKLMVDYDTINFISIQNYKDYSSHIIIDILEIYKDSLIILMDTNKKKKFRINGMQWNNAIIQLQQDNINLQIITTNQIVQETYTHFNIKNIVNKEILIYQEGLYIGHLSTQYKDFQFYCSPGCISCQNNKCLECQQDQYLADNQCYCQKFYQSQNIDGECKSIQYISILKVYPDLYQQNLQQLDYDLFQENICLFGFIHSRGNCNPCPWFQDKLCSDCIYKPQLYDDKILNCWQNGIKIEYILEQDQYIPHLKEKISKIFHKQESQQNKIIKNYTQLLVDKHDKNQCRGGNFTFGSLFLSSTRSSINLQLGQLNYFFSPLKLSVIIYCSAPPQLFFLEVVSSWNPQLVQPQSYRSHKYR